MQNFSQKYFSSVVEYSHSFQGQEKDDEIKGEGNSVNYKYRMHDTRVGRFFAVDPLAPKFPHNSPYAFSENSTVAYIELEGLEKYYAADGSYLGQVGSSTEIRVVNDVSVWYKYATVRDAFSNGETSLDLGNGTKIDVNYDLYNSLETNLLNNSATVTLNREDLVKKFFESHLQKSSDVEYGVIIYERQFTDFEGNTFTGYVSGSVVKGNQAKNFGDDPSAPVEKSLVTIGGVEIARPKSYNGWKVSAIVHTHIRRNKISDAGFSHDDIMIINRYKAIGYMMEYSTGNNLYIFDSSIYLKLDPYWEYFDVGGYIDKAAESDATRIVDWSYLENLQKRPE